MKSSYKKIILLCFFLANLHLINTLGCKELECYKRSFSSCEKISKGGQGVIYKVTMKSDKSSKVLKEMEFPHGKSKDYFEARGQLYLQMMRTIPEDKTNVMRIFGYEVNHKDEVFCLLQEYIQGEIMKKYMIEEIFTPSETDSWISEKIRNENRQNKKSLFYKLLHCMMDSISTINSRGYYHVDVKGENFMVDTTQTCKLIDFDSTVNKDTDLSSVDVAFTRSYAAPEVVYYLLKNLCSKTQSAICQNAYAQEDWMKRQNFSKGESFSNSDPFAIGVILYQILFNNNNPFYLRKDFNDYCYKKRISDYLCYIDYLASIYYQINKNIYDKSSYNYEFINSAVSSPAVSDNFYEVMNRHYDNFGMGNFVMDFTSNELNALFYIMRGCLMINPDNRLTMTEAKYLFEETVLKLNK
jgi:serine/threonine protein kinase